MTDEVNKIDISSCPEIILFSEMHLLERHYFELCHKQKLEKEHPSVQKIAEKMIKLSEQLTRFGIDSSTINYKKDFKYWFEGEALEWYKWWNKYWTEDLSREEWVDFNEDYRAWKKDKNYDLSKWRPSGNWRN